MPTFLWGWTEGGEEATPPPQFVAEGAAGITHDTPSASTLLTATPSRPLRRPDVRSALFCGMLSMVTGVGVTGYTPAGNY